MALSGVPQTSIGIGKIQREATLTQSRTAMREKNAALSAGPQETYQAGAPVSDPTGGMDGAFKMLFRCGCPQ